MNKIFTAIASVLIGLSLIAHASPAEATPGVISHRLTICLTDEGDAVIHQAPCVWWAEYQGNGEGRSFIARPSGRVQWISHRRAEISFTTVLTRREASGRWAGPLENRIDVCYDPEGGSGSSLPCVFDPATYGLDERSGVYPVVVRRSGKAQEVASEEARRLTLVVAYRERPWR